MGGAQHAMGLGGAGKRKNIAEVVEGADGGVVEL